MSTKLDIKQYGYYTNGNWQKPLAYFTVTDPASKEPLSKVPDMNREEVKKVYQNAQEAFQEWSKMTHAQRAKCLNKVADILESRTKEIGIMIAKETGSWIGKGMFEAGYIPGIFRSAAAAAYMCKGEIVPSDHNKISHIVREPIGVVSSIAPWNFPALLSGRAIAVPLAVGNTVVLKPSELTPVTGGYLYAEVFEEAGIPPGVFNVISCDRANVVEVGDEMVINPSVKAISFTGSTNVGRTIAVKAAEHFKKACLELGGKNPLLVLEDADINKAVEAATFGGYMHQGQICMSTERVIVNEKIADEFIERFVKNVKSLKSGNTMDPGSPIGPIINDKQLKNILDLIEDAKQKGAKVLTGGGNNGRYIEPTVLANIDESMAIFQQETFGPVTQIFRVKNDNEAIDLANNSEYGLSCGIITKDEQKGIEIARQLEIGMCHINCCSVNDEPHIPFGGMKNSGIGRHGGQASINTFTKTRWFTIEKGGRPYPPPFKEKV